MLVTLLAAGGMWPVLAVGATGREGGGLCATATAERVRAPSIVVLSAFPAELSYLVTSAEIDATGEIEGKTYYRGRLDGVRVILGLTGIGIINARNTARTVLASVEVAGVVMSGVAGSSHRIGDVVVAADWVEQGRKRAFPANAALRALARRAETTLAAPLEKCTPVPPTSADASVVCLFHDPVIVRGGRGVSGDPFGGNVFPCTPGAGEIFGCELPLPLLAGASVGRLGPQEVAPVAEDMETAAVARVAAQRNVPFLGVRAVSDGAGDPLGDRGFPAQFFDYYRLAARNAGIVTRAVVAEVGRLARDPSARRVCGLLARRRWRQAAARIDTP
jgi:adenosylhomocysteine nucleosidase